MGKGLIIGIVVVFILVGGLIFYFGFGGEEINSFEECVVAGNPVMESYPRQCRASGETFVEEIDLGYGSVAWDAEVAKLIGEGCVGIQVDGDGNSCFINEEGDDFQSCTEMVTTDPYDLPVCVEYV
jgi:hypothetical protein